MNGHEYGCEEVSLKQMGLQSKLYDLATECTFCLLSTPRIKSDATENQCKSAGYKYNSSIINTLLVCRF